MKKKNQFDSKDMILLVVILFIIYVFVSWFGNSGELMDYGNPTSTETSQTDTKGGN